MKYTYVIKDETGTEVDFFDLTPAERSRILKAIKADDKDAKKAARKTKAEAFVTDVAADPVKLGLAIGGIILATVAIGTATYFIIKTVADNRAASACCCDGGGEVEAAILGGADVY